MVNRQAAILKKKGSTKLKAKCGLNNFGSNKNQSARNTYCNESFLWYVRIKHTTILNDL
jgi:hypothetical protein